MKRERRRGGLNDMSTEVSVDGLTRSIYKMNMDDMSTEVSVERSRNGMSGGAKKTSKSKGKKLNRKQRRETPDVDDDVDEEFESVTEKHQSSDEESIRGSEDITEGKPKKHHEKNHTESESSYDTPKKHNESKKHAMLNEMSSAVNSYWNFQIVESVDGAGNINLQIIDENWAGKNIIKPKIF
jgi:hypothetical protein